MQKKEFPWQPSWLAFLRIFSDIAYASDIATEANIEDIQQAPRFEQRYKSVTNLIRQRGSKQILELAAGLSSRGLFMTTDPSINYTETGLPKVIREKERIVERLLDKVGSARPNLRFMEVNAFNYRQMLDASSNFSGPITIVSEGLFSYLKAEKQQLLAKNIHQLLSAKGGVWITPDITTKQEWARSYGRNLSAMYARKVYLFNTEAQLNDFFAKMRFQAEQFSQSVLAGELVSVERLRLNRGLVADKLRDMRIYCLSPQSTKTS
jgi:O-methyltransferase involved in polyketide biosynthesis